MHSSIDSENMQSILESLQAAALRLALQLYFISLRFIIAITIYDYEFD